MVERPPAEVYGLLADLRRATEWQPSLESVEVETEGQTRVGTSGREVRRAGGRRIESRFEVTALEPERRIVVFTRARELDANAEFAVEPNGDGTRVRATVDLHLHGMLRFAAAALRGRAHNQTRADLERLKRLLEGGT